MSAEAITFHSRLRPFAPAIEYRTRKLSYLEASAALARITVALQATAGLAGRRLVGVAIDDPLIELLTLMAFEALGIATLPFVQPSDPGIVAALLHCDLIASEHPVAGHPGPFMPLSQKWAHQMLHSGQEVELQLVRGEAHQMVHSFTSSGTSGAAKVIRLDRAADEARVRARLWQYGLDGESRLLLGMLPTTSSAYFVAQAAFRVGAAVLMLDHLDPLRHLDQATHLIILPIHLRGLAERVTSPRTGPRLKIFVVGAVLSHSLREFAERSLNADVVEAYGTAETAWLAEIDRHGQGRVLPTVTLEVVDDAGIALPLNAVGEIRVRSPEMGQGYMEQGQSEMAFRDGWFYTGDLGRTQRPGHIELLGRRDHIMNLGGIKVSPELIEDVLVSLELAQDVGACSIADERGIEQLIIVCAEPRASVIELQEKVSLALGRNLGRITVLLVNQIRRTANGKIQRAILAHDVKTQLPHALPPTARGLDAGLP